MFHKYKESAESLKSLFKVFVELWNIVKKNPAPFILVALVVAGFLGARHYAYEMPGEVIRNYYLSLGEHDHRAAWDILSDDYRERRWSTFEEYRQGYINFSASSNLAVSYVGGTWNVVSDALKSTKKYIVSYEIREGFTKDDLSDASQWRNALWVQLIHGVKKHERLMKGELRSLTIRRFFEEIWTLKKQNGEWKVAAIERIRWGRLQRN